MCNFDSVLSKKYSGFLDQNLMLNPDDPRVKKIVEKGLEQAKHIFSPQTFEHMRQVDYTVAPITAETHKQMSQKDVFTNHYGILEHVILNPEAKNPPVIIGPPYASGLHSEGFAWRVMRLAEQMSDHPIVSYNTVGIGRSETHRLSLSKLRSTAKLLRDLLDSKFEGERVFLLVLHKVVFCH